MGAPEPRSALSKGEPAILHVDMDAFFASVEALENPELRNRPLIVGGSGARGVVASCSYEARSYGVRSAMPSVQAKRLCPHAVFVDGHYHLYEEYSRRMHDVLTSFTPLVEGISLDEAFLDVRGARRLFGIGEEIAWSIRRMLMEQLGLSASVGVATTKHLAKLASVSAKPRASRDGPTDARGVVVVSDEDALEFLHRLPVRGLWGVGPKAAERLARVGVATVGELARLDVDQLVRVLGDATARHLHDLAWNIDGRNVEPDRVVKSIGHEQTYAADLYTHDEMHLQWVRLADAVSSRLRKAGMSGRTVNCKIRFATFETVTRARTMSSPTATTADLVSTADELSSDIDVSRGVRLLGLSVSNLVTTGVMGEQLTLLALDEERTVDALDMVVDGIRERYGSSAVVPAPLVGPGGQGIVRKGDQQWGPSQSSSPSSSSSSSRRSSSSARQSPSSSSSRRSSSSARQSPSSS